MIAAALFRMEGLRGYARSAEGVSFLVTAALVLTALGVDALSGLTFRNHYSEFIFPVALLWPIFLFCMLWTQASRLAEGVYYFWLQFALAHAMVHIACATHRLALPLRDAEFAQVDAGLGFDWNRWQLFLHAHPALLNFLAAAYNTHIPQAALACFLLPFVLPRKGNLRFLLAMALASVITILVGAVVPALGPGHFYGLTPGWVPLILELRQHAIPGVLPYYGVISFPSFHTAMAMLLVGAYLGVRPLMAAAIPINVALLIGVPFAGSHYLVDMLGGAVVGIASFGFAHGLASRFETDPSRSPFALMQLRRYGEAAPSRG